MTFSIPQCKKTTILHLSHIAGTHARKWPHTSAISISQHLRTKTCGKIRSPPASNALSDSQKQYISRPALCFIPFINVCTQIGPFSFKLKSIIFIYLIFINFYQITLKNPGLMHAIKNRFIIFSCFLHIFQRYYQARYSNVAASNLCVRMCLIGSLAA